MFGDYVSTYNFRDSIEDGATVPLYYENRIPELQIVNERFDEELSEILEQAELDDTQERALARRFATEYQLITRPERLRRLAADLVRHFVGRGLPRQGDVRRDRQGDRDSHVRPRHRRVADAPDRAP